MTKITNQKIPVVEHFFSLQGEGPTMGEHSYFIRLGGCNLRCEFGCKQGTPKKLKQLIANAKHYSNLKELPVLPTYCDSYPAIHSEFKHLWDYKTPQQLIDLAKDSLTNIVLTGGEPLLYQEFIQELARDLVGVRLTIETNGTIPLQPDTVKALNYEYNKALLVISPKIGTANYIPSKLYKDVTTYRGVKHKVLKIVVGKNDKKTINEIFELQKAFRVASSDIYLMPVGGVNNQNFQKMREIVWDMALTLGYNYSDRLQMIKKNKWGV